MELELGSPLDHTLHDSAETLMSAMSAVLSLSNHVSKTVS